MKEEKEDKEKNSKPTLGKVIKKKLKSPSFWINVGFSALAIGATAFAIDRQRKLSAVRAENKCLTTANKDLGKELNKMNYFLGKKEAVIETKVYGK